MVNAQIFGHLFHDLAFIHLGEQFPHGTLHSFWQAVDVLRFDSNTNLAVLYSDKEIPQFTSWEGFDNV